MKTIQFDRPTSVYFIGIGGVSMSGLAHILIDRGFEVAGSDAHGSMNTEHLEKEGATIFIGQKAENITNKYKVVVYTAAIHSDNPEYQQAMKLGIPLLNRKDLLAEVMAHYHNSVAVAGTHGKTTTTAMLSYIFLAAELDPTISIGANFKKIQGNVRIGHSEVFLAEACEYTNSFLALKPLASIILNIEEDHLDFFKDIQDIRNSFHQFVLKTSKDGVVVIHSAIDNVEEIVQDYPGKVLQFGLYKGDLYTKNIQHLNHGGNKFDVYLQEEYLGSIELSVGGQHNITNALAAIAVALSFDIRFEAIKEGLKNFHGADRRFEKKGFYKDIEIIDDYAHHPQEIKAALDMAKDYPHDHLVIVFQPHTYSRTKFLFEEFAQVLSQVDQVLLAPIYAAREVNDGSMSSDLLAKRIHDLGGNALSLGSFTEIKDYLKKNLKKGDLCLTLGAGNVYEIGEELVQEN
ncbi:MULTISPECIES: UDP-N-acetylmuramate--L-alanine ligase [Terrabacteria group]|uniref:UDP-N-acetylmuramate--L-alanine ligase n=1 Tax=Bacillati TaxID=1783272 RepID=UPI001939E51D|nr:MULTISPECIES: UDP-N-acetylmuramate--L-alanine ligase [Terrabacteria group]MBW9211951.1 UDP-N-acetylmuramate--L-alanine ligase [Trueperella sp. zg.1013]QRG87249.1 UDP-N-acetylmuramate--L-alanine ligase [Bulleidia sp. zg-1006]